MGAFAKKIGKTGLNAVMSPSSTRYEGSKNNNQRVADSRRTPYQQESERKAAILEAYNNTVRQPGLLSGERPEDPSMRRIRKGIFNSPDGWTAQVAIYDQAARGWTKSHQEGVGVTVSMAATFEDGRQGMRRMDFTPGVGTELRVATTDYTTGPQGEPIIHQNKSWASEVLGGAEASMEQVELVQQVLTGDTVWADTVAAPHQPAHR